MASQPWTVRELGLLKRAMRLYESQFRLIVACEPELAERGYESIRIRSQKLDGEDIEEVDGLRADYAPAAVLDQCREIARAPANRSTVPGSLKGHEPLEEGTQTKDRPDGGKEVQFVGRHLRTEQEIRNEAGLTRERWECVKFEYSDHQVPMKGHDDEPDRVVTMHRAFARFKPREGYDELEQFRDEVLKEMGEHAPEPPDYEPPAPADDPHMLELDFADIHLGKLAHGPEVDGNHFDSKIVTEDALDALDRLLFRAKPYDVEQVLIPVGNDIFHTDTPEQTTTAGTRQDTDSRPALMATRVVRLAVQIIDRAATLAPVKVVIVPGNHDEQMAFMLGLVLDAWYRNTDRVTVDCTPTLRKYELYGVSLIGFTHGKDEKPRDLPLIMARERPHEWADADYHTWHIGHLHKKKETRYIAGDTFNGVEVRVLQSLSDVDFWHYRKGFVKGRRAAEAFLWSKTDGPAGQLPAFARKRSA